MIGMGLLIFMGFLNAYSCHLLIKTRPYGGDSYGDLAQKALGHAGVVVTEACMFGSCFGSMCSYLVILADLIAPLVRLATGIEDLVIDRFIIILGSMVVLYPLSSLRSMDALKYTSTIAMLSMAYLIVVIVIKGGDNISSGGITECPDGCVTLVQFSLGLFQAMPIIVFAFTCHMNIFSIFNELKEPTNNKFRQICYRTFMVCGTAYALAGGCKFSCYSYTRSGTCLFS